MKVYFHRLYTEAHRSYRRGRDFADALEAEGCEVALHLDSSCDVALCGAFCLDSEFSAEVQRHDEFLRENGMRRIPVVHLCFDLYPVHMEGRRTGMNSTELGLWHRYASNLRRAAAVVAPSESAARRVRQYTAHGDVRVVRCAADPWWRGHPVTPGGGHVLDVLRPVDDWGCGKVSLACQRLKIPCVESRGALSRDEFRRAVLGARLLVCAHDEASTGGLTLLEGYALGKPVLASDSSFCGAGEYFGSRAAYFERGSFEALKAAVARLWAAPPGPAADAAAWVAENFSDAAMARGVAAVLRDVAARG